MSKVEMFFPICYNDFEFSRGDGNLNITEMSLVDLLDVWWFLELFFQCAAWVVLCHGVVWKRNERGRILLEFVLLLVVSAGGKSLVASLIASPGVYNLVWALVHAAISAIYMFLCAPYEKYTRLLLWCSLYASALSIVAIAGQSSVLIGAFVSKGAAEGAIRCLVDLLMIGSAFYLRKFNFDDLPHVPNSGLTLILMGNFSLLLLYVTENFFFGLDYSVVITLLIAYVCMFCMMMAAINATYTLCSEQGSIISLQAEKQRLMSEREMIHMAEASLEDLRCIRHDLKNQYAYMQILLQEERYEDLKHYFNQVSENLPSQLNMIECGNHTMNTILNMAFSKLKSERISVEYHLVVPPILPFPDDDMCAIVINLMDNAADECRRLLQNGKDNIGMRLEIYPYRSYLYIMCSNSTDRKEISRLQSGLRTTKKDTQLHGYGTRIVSKLAEKHNGCAEFSLEEDRFVAKVMLDMTGEELANED
jgi:hypothetical protein